MLSYVIVCPNRPTEVFDVVEARARGIDLDLGASDLSLDEKFELVLGRVGAFNETRADFLREKIQFYKDNVSYVSGVELVDVPDSDHQSIPRGCQIKQIAIQKAPDFPEDSYFTVDRELWDQLSVDQQLVLILHEVLFLEAISVGHRNSRKARYLNSYLFSDKLESLDEEGYQGLLANAGFPYRSSIGVLFQGNSVVMDGAHILSGILFVDTEFAVYNGVQVTMKSGHPVVFHPNGRIKSGVLGGEVTVYSTILEEDAWYSYIPQYDRELEFDEEGRCLSWPDP